VDAQLVHVAQPRRDVLDLARLLRGVHLPAHPSRDLGELARGEHRASEAPELALDEPPGGLAPVRMHDPRPKLAVRRIHVVPRALGFDDVRIRIDSRHRAAPPAVVSTRATLPRAQSCAERSRRNPDIWWEPVAPTK